MSLDDFIFKAGIKRVDFIKADIEGWELQMLMGAQMTLKRFRPAILIELDEHHLARAGGTLESAWSFLTGLGYVPHIMEKNLALMELTQARSGDIWWTFDTKRANEMPIASAIQ
jgi:hypothetical protein